MNTKTMSIISLVCGIVGLVGGALTQIPVIGWLVPLCPLAGIIFGAIALKQIKATGAAESKGLATAGLVLGIVALALDLLVIIACVACAAALGSAGALSELSNLM